VLCVNPNDPSDTRAAVGGKCPSGYQPMDTGTDPQAVVDGLLAALGGGVKTADGEYVPYQADTRPTGVSGYSGGVVSEGAGKSVYTLLKDFETLRTKDPNKYRGIVNQMRKAGLIGPRVTSLATISDAYKLVLEGSASLYEEGVVKPPDAILNELSKGSGALGLGGDELGPTGGAAAYTGPRSTVQLSNETTAYTLLNTAARDMIGRDLTPDEVRKYTSELNRIEGESAQVTTPQGPGMTVYSGGVDRQEVVRQLISDNPDFAGYQLNHEIMDTILADIDEGQAFLNEWS